MYPFCVALKSAHFSIVFFQCIILTPPVGTFEALCVSHGDIILEETTQDNPEQGQNMPFGVVLVPLSLPQGGDEGPV